MGQATNSWPVSFSKVEIYRTYDTQDAGQIHELEGLSRLSIDFLPPVLEMIHLSTVLNVEDVKLLLD